MIVKKQLVLGTIDEGHFDISKDHIKDIIKDIVSIYNKIAKEVHEIEKEERKILKESLNGFSETLFHKHIKMIQDSEIIEVRKLKKTICNMISEINNRLVFETSVNVTDEYVIGDNFILEVAYVQ